CETLWAGIPIITLRGRRHAGRISASILAAMGLEGLVAEDIGTYIDTAARLANDLPELETLRAGIRSRMSASPLRDEIGFARALESAYQTMWRQYCAEARSG